MGKMILKKEKIVLIWKCFNISYRYIYYLIDIFKKVYKFSWYNCNKSQQPPQNYNNNLK